MWSAIASIISAIVSLGATVTGLQNPLNQTTASAQNYNIQACFQPDLTQTITLTWPDNFVNVPDSRSALNPELYAGVPAAFSSTADTNRDSIPDCKAIVMDSPTTDLNQPTVSRNFIKVRSDVRIASCKTDELAGLYGIGSCPDYKGTSAAASRHRGMCNTDSYTDLRKVAEVNQNGQNMEIFWNPFSYHVGCDFQKDVNCGPGDRRNVNLKDFIYVLKARDAFDPLTHPACPVMWDAGSVDMDACSHYFDVYMAEDLYYRLQSIPATTDPDHPDYFLKQVVENCQEQNLFIPSPDADVYLPPYYIPRPFGSTGQFPLGKINPLTSLEKFNYNIYVNSKPDVINPSLTNLIRVTIMDGPLNLCQPYHPMPTKSPATNPAPIAPPQACFDPLGKIDFADPGGSGTSESFNVYSNPSYPQTFYLVKTTELNAVYVYTYTDREFPANTIYNPTLQLTKLQFITQNQWTWATPWCKPAIYLYPQEPTEVNVKLKLDGKLTESIPQYDINEGWNVTASPDGSLIHLEDKDTSVGGEATTSTPPRWSKQTYPYLYYEADLNNVAIPHEGWVVERANIKDKILKILTDSNFNEKEISDFLAYWLPRLTEKPYYFVTLIPEKIINEKEKLSFSVQPDTLIRTRIVFEGLDLPIFIAPPDLSGLIIRERKGFTITDWGGRLVGKDCKDVTVK